MNPYQILQLPQSATYEQIKQRYRHLSKMVHPDKHPIQNYQIAQSHFKQIDQAYKAISSDLRRYVYKHYGPTGITIVENSPFTFSQFQKADLDDPLVLNRLNQVLVYCLYEEHASNQIDKNVLKTKSIMLVNKPINNINQLPSMERSQFSFQTSLPDFFGMSHTINLTHASEGLNAQTKSGMVYGIGSSKRINQTLMLNAHTHISGQRTGIQMSIDKAINNNLVLHFIPINLQNGQLHNPQIGADFHRDNYYVSAVTDLNDMTIQIGSSPANKSVTKSIKLGFEGKAFMLAPVYQRQITPRLRMFIHMQIRGQRAQANSSNVSFGVAYGYRLKLLQQLKLELASYIGVPHSNFQISILTPKFKASIPIFSRSQILTFQLYKLSVFIGVYLSFQLYNYYMRKNTKRRKRVQFQNYNRLSVEKNAIAKNNSDFHLIAEQQKQKQIKFNGLVILASFIGSQYAIKYNISRIKKLKILGKNKNNKKLSQILQTIQKLKEQTLTSQDDHKYQLFQITQSVQAKVKGSQLLEFNVEQLRVNPCVDQREPFYSLTLYYMRDQVFLLKKRSSQAIKIGNLKARYSKSWSAFIWDYIKNKLIN